MGPGWRGMSTYYNSAWARSTPPEVRTTQNLHGDTRLFDVASSEVVWSTATTTVTSRGNVTTQIDVLAAIKEAIRDTGVAALYITHDLSTLRYVCHRMGIMYLGRIVEIGTGRVSGQVQMGVNKTGQKGQLAQVKRLCLSGKGVERWVIPGLYLLYPATVDYDCLIDKGLPACAVNEPGGPESLRCGFLVL